MEELSVLSADAKGCRPGLLQGKGSFHASRFRPGLVDKCNTRIVEIGNLWKL